MATIYNHAQIGVIDSSGNVNVIYPLTYAKDVTVEQGSNTYLKNNAITTAQGLAETAGTDILDLQSRTEAIEAVTIAKNAGTHNALYRGKNITSLGLTEIKNRISSGEFTDLYIGDYFTTNITTSYGTETVYNVLTDFDYFWHCGDTSLGTHHAVIMPMYCFNNACAMNPSGKTHTVDGTTKTISGNTTEGGYAQSYMKQTELPKYSTALKTALGDMLITHRVLLSIAVDTKIVSSGYTGWYGASSNWSWSDSTLDLASENMVYGAQINSSGRYDVGCSKTQLNLFRHMPSMLQTGTNSNHSGRYSWWLSGVASSPYFAFVSYDGLAAANFASLTYFCVRPLYLIS